jgi:trimeric autotransporter adhesin
MVSPMKKLLLLFSLGIYVNGHAQTGVGINTTGAVANSNAILDISATDKGLLVPRVDLVNLTGNAISTFGISLTPTVSLLVYNTTASSFPSTVFTTGFYYWDGSFWTKLFAGSTNNTAWGLGGNAFTTAANFIGTIDAQPLRFAVKGGSAGIIDSAKASTAFGLGALRNNSSGSANAAVGTNALNFNTTGIRNVAMGAQALFRNTLGNYNTAAGYAALNNSTTGAENVAIGDLVLYNNLTGNGNTGIGNEAMLNNVSGYSNVAIGTGALRSSISNSNIVAVGDSALYNSSADGNTAIGGKSLFNNTSGDNNTAGGIFTLSNNTTGRENTAFGRGALLANVAGDRNNAFGRAALWQNKGTDNIGIGNYCGATSAAPNVNNTITIGAGTAVNNGTNQVILGNSSNTGLYFIYGGTSWLATSDRRMKNTIQENVPGLSFIQKLRPVTYHYDIKKMMEITSGHADTTKDWEGKYDAEKRTFTGLIAQEVEQAAKECNYDFSGVLAPAKGRDYYNLGYSDFVMPLVKGMQEQQAQIELLQKQNALLLKRLEALEKK